MKSLAFAVGLIIAAVGVIGLLAPAALVWLAGCFASPLAWYALAAFRIAFGILLLFVARMSRAPRTLRIVALVPIVAGLAIPIVGVERARATVEWWTRQGPAVARLSTIPVLILGGFVAYACAPRRGAA